MDYLYEFGLDNTDIEIMAENLDENAYSDYTLLKNLIKTKIYDTTNDTYCYTFLIDYSVCPN